MLSMLIASTFLPVVQVAVVVVLIGVIEGMTVEGKYLHKYSVYSTAF